jgi:hypothetical protein
MAIAREKILERRNKLEEQQAKNRERLKALKEKLREDSRKIHSAEKKEEMQRKLILGSYFLEKSKTDPSFKTWLDGEIASSNLGTYEKRLFGAL